MINMQICILQSIICFCLESHIHNSAIIGNTLLSVNGRSVAGLTHSEAIGIFKETKIGTIQVTIGRWEGKKMVQIDGDDQY